MPVYIQSPSETALDLIRNPKPQYEVRVPSSEVSPLEFSLPGGYRVSFDSSLTQDNEAPKFNPKEFTSEKFQQQVDDLLSKLSKLHPFYANASEAVKRHGYNFKLYSEDDSNISKEHHKLMSGGAPAMTLTLDNIIFIRAKDLDSSLDGQKSFIRLLTNELVHAALDVDSRKYSDKEAEALFSEALIAEKEGRKDWTLLEKDLFSHTENELSSSIIPEAMVPFIYDKTPITLTMKSLSEDQFLKTRRKPNYLMGSLELKFGTAAMKRIKDGVQDQANMPEDVKALLTRMWRRLASSDTEEALITIFKTLKVIP